MFFAIQVLIFGICLGAIISVLVFVPIAIYTIPYALWVGTKNLSGQYEELKDEKLSRTIRNATILYKSWIFKKEPNF